MAEFGDMVLTNAGRNLIAKTMDGKQLKFTRAWSGDGVLPDGMEIRSMTHLIHPILEMGITGIDAPVNIGTATIKLLMTNKDLERGFCVREIGLLAEDPDTGEEVMYGYCNAGEKWDYMPGYGGADVVFYRVGLEVVIDQATVTAVIVDDPAGVTEEELNDRFDDIRRDYKARDEFLQKQIDQVAEASIKRSLYHAEKQLDIGQEEAE